MAEILCSFDVCLCLCVCVSVCLSVHSGPVNQLIANSSKMAKVTDFKSDRRVPRDSPDMSHDPHKFSPKGGVARVTCPPKFLGVKC